MDDWVGGAEKLTLKLTSASTEVGVEARAELGKIGLLFKVSYSYKKPKLSPS